MTATDATIQLAALAPGAGRQLIIGGMDEEPSLETRAQRFEAWMKARPWAIALLLMLMILARWVVGWAN